MPNYRRYHQHSASYFFTVVSYRRRAIFTTDIFRQALRNSVIEVKQQFPFRTEAWVLLPDHFHCIWSFDDGDLDYSRRWSMIKRKVSQRLMDKTSTPQSLSRYRRRESNLWQRRFWEHRIRGDEDLQNHLDYCYWNPVKHGLVSRVADWPYSTFHRDVGRGLYPSDWGDGYIESEGNFGE